MVSRVGSFRRRGRGWQVRDRAEAGLTVDRWAGKGGGRELEGILVLGGLYLRRRWTVSRTKGKGFTVAIPNLVTERCSPRERTRMDGWA